MRLRDIEVANDDFERQARNTHSSLEDMEAKYNQAIERAVLMDEEIKMGEQEREALRIETQRLRDELSDLRIEAEIMHDKLRKRQLSPIETQLTAPDSSPFEASPASTASSPLITTPPDTKSVSTDALSPSHTPPSPPMSDASAPPRPALKTPSNGPKSKLKLPTGDSSTTPKPSLRYPSAGKSANAKISAVPTPSARGRTATPSLIRNTKSKAPPTRGLPNSTSLNHIRTLTAQMQRLEQRVQSARSKLPAPVNTPPCASPRNGSAMGNHMPSSVTIRSRKRTGGSTVSSSSLAGEDTPSSTHHVSRLSTSGISRLSFGPINRDNECSRPSSRTSTNFSRPMSRTETPGRPMSRTEIARPASRTSVSRTQTPLGHYSQSQMAESRRPRSSIGGNYHGHGHSQSVSNITDSRDADYNTPSRRGSTFSNTEASAIPAPSSALPRRKSGGLASNTPGSRRTTSGASMREDAGMKPPGRPRKLSGVGETY